MSGSSLAQQLGLLEDQFSAVSSALVGADPSEVRSSSAKLQQLAVELLQILGGCGRDSLHEPQLAHRLHALAQSMPLVRENLARRSAYVERALALLVPQALAQATYADNSGPYGGGARTSGQFKAFSA
jgi:hypothetical protein